MNYTETLDYLYARLPMFTRMGSSAIRPGLKNIKLFSKQLNYPEKKFKCIHVGGTNGKGSTSHMLAAILQKAGYKTGLYTSPHLVDFRERMRINGEMISKEKVVAFVKQHKDFIEEISPSYFEVTVAMAFQFFAQEEVDIAVIEVGLGGRLDSTNIIQPELSVITNISKDHTNLLGNTLEEIAFEKAGIIKNNRPVIISEFAHESAPVFIKKAASTQSQLLFADKTYDIDKTHKSNEYLCLDVLKEGEKYYEKLSLDLNGSYQSKNILGVIAATDQLTQLGWHISEENIRSALMDVKGSTGLTGRWHKLSDNPLSYCDTGHNEAGMQEVIKNIQTTPHNQLHFVIGMVKDKDISTVLNLLPQNARYYFCKPAMERGLDEQELQHLAAALQLCGTSYTSVNAAYNAAKKAYKAGDLIFIGGSTFVVAEIL